MNVIVSIRALKNLRKVPLHIAQKFLLWKRTVEEIGINNAEYIRHYKDEALTGKLKDWRSIRLNQAYRAYYRIVNDAVKILYVEEVNKHDYKKIERIY